MCARSGLQLAFFSSSSSSVNSKFNEAEFSGESKQVRPQRGKAGGEKGRKPQIEEKGKEREGESGFVQFERNEAKRETEASLSPLSRFQGP